MTVKKSNGFRAPYRSDTFQRQAGAQTVRPGILSMAGPVTQAGPTITVPPFSFMQVQTDLTTGEKKGLIVEKDAATSVAAPSTTAPFALIVSANTPADVDDLQFTFAKSPADYAEKSVVVAVYDGVEWRVPDEISIDGLMVSVDQANVDFGRVGPAGGLLTTISGPNYSNSPGVVVDTQGHRERLPKPALFPIVATDPDYARVDRIVYRRPMDAPPRIGLREFTTGGTYSASPATIRSHPALFDNTKERQNARLLIGTDNAAHAFCATGYGSSFQLSYAKVSSDRTTVTVSAINLQAMTDPVFAVAVDGSNNLHAVFIQSGHVYYRKFGPTGTALTSAIQVETGSTPCTAPAVAIDPANSKVFVVYQSLLGANNNQIFFLTRDLNGNAVTGAKNLTGNAQNLQNPDIVVTDDDWVYVSYEDSVLTKAYYRRFDDIGNPLAAAVYVSGATNRIGFGTIVDGAKSVKVRVADNKSVFVTFLQDKGGSVYGLSIWNDGAAFQQQLLTSGENFTTYSLGLDASFNSLHLDVARSSSLDYVKLGGQTVLFTLNLGSSVSSVTGVLDRLGSMYHLWARALSGTYTNYATNKAITDIGPATATGTMNNIVMTSSQMLLATASFTSPVPQIGDRVVITGAANGGNNTTKFITNVETLSKNSSNDTYRITVGVAFAAAESPAAGPVGAFAAPDGDQVDAVKSTSELAALAFRFDALPSDVLLTRIGMPGSHILDWLQHDRPALDADSFLVHGTSVTIDWGLTSAGNVTLAGGMKILDMVHNIDYAVANGSYPMADGQALYVVLDGVNTSVTPLVLPMQNVPWASPVQVLGVVKDTKFHPTALLSAAGVGNLEVGESDQIGEDLPVSIRARVGITSDTTYEAYTSTAVIATNDTYPEALSKLDNEVGALENNHPLEDKFSAPGGTDTFTTSVVGLSWSTDNTKFDIQVWVNGRRQTPFGLNVGSLTPGTFRKLSTTSFQVAGNVGIGQLVEVRKEGTSYGGPAAPAAGNLWSDIVDSSIVGPDMAFSVGGPSNRFANGYFANITLNQLSFTTGLGLITQIKTKTNGDAVNLVAGKIASLAADGKLYTADSDSATGQVEVGLLLQTIVPGAQGKIMLFGPNVPGILASLGFSPGDTVYVSETGTYVTGAGGFTGGNDTIARVGWADCADGLASSVATDLIMNYGLISAAP